MQTDNQTKLWEDVGQTDRLLVDVHTDWYTDLQTHRQAARLSGEKMEIMI